MGIPSDIAPLIPPPPGFVAHTVADIASSSSLLRENAVLEQQHARLAQENYMLRMQRFHLAANLFDDQIPPWDPLSMRPAATTRPTVSLAHRIAAPPSRQTPFLGAVKAAMWPGRDTESTLEPKSKRADDASTSASDDAASRQESDKNGKKKALQSAGPRTTVMLRNLPEDLTREKLLDLIDGAGFARCYDLVYLPIDFTAETALGYAFVNLISTDDAERFFAKFAGSGSDASVSEEGGYDAAWSDALQGLAPHVERYRNSPVMHESVPDAFRPVLFDPATGQRVAFPPPTAVLRPPRRWARRRPAAP